AVANAELTRAASKGPAGKLPQRQAGSDVGPQQDTAHDCVGGHVELVATEANRKNAQLRGGGDGSQTRGHARGKHNVRSTIDEFLRDALGGGLIAAVAGVAA